MFSLATQVMIRRWMLSVVIVLMMMITLLNTTATIGLSAYINTAVDRAVKERYHKESYFVHDPTVAEHNWFSAYVGGPKELDYSGRLYGLSNFWQAYGFKREAYDSDFSFLPLKVIEYSSAWALPLLEGTMPARSDHMVVNSYMAKHYGIGIGNVLLVEGYGTIQSYIVVGIVQDLPFESEHQMQQRIFVHTLKGATSDGLAFDVAYNDSPGELQFDMLYQTVFHKPFVAERVSVDDVRNSRIEPMAKPLFFANVVWFLQFLLIVFLMIQVMRYLVVQYPLSLVSHGRYRFVHLDVYLNYYMLLIIIAYGASLMLLRPYLENLTGVLGHEIGSMSTLQLGAIHMIGLGFWMNVFVVINALLQRWFRRRYKETNLQYYTNTEPSIRFKVPQQILMLVIGNTLVALLLIVGLEVNYWSNTIIQYPSLWGFSTKPVALNIDANPSIAGYDYEPVVVQDTQLTYATGVVSEQGFEDFDIRLIEGRLPKWPNELVVGLGLTNDEMGLGSILTYHNRSGVHEGVIVGIANALINNGHIIGYMAPSQKTLSFDREAPGEYIKFTTFIQDAQAYLKRATQNYLLPLIAGMVAVGLMIVVVVYAQMSAGLQALRLMLKVSRLKQYHKLGGLFLYGMGLSLVSYVIARLIWLLGLLPMINTMGIPLGIKIMSMTQWTLRGCIALGLLCAFNMIVGYLVIVRGSNT